MTLGSNAEEKARERRAKQEQLKQEGYYIFEDRKTFNAALNFVRLQDAVSRFLKDEYHLALKIVEKEEA